MSHHLWPTSAFVLILAYPLAAQQGPKVPVPEPDPGPRKPKVEPNAKAKPVAKSAAKRKAGPPSALVMTGNLQINVNAPAAVVYVDGRKMGTASPTEALNLERQPVGEVVVKVEAEGYQAKQETVRIKRDDWTQVALVLEKKAVAGPAVPRQEAETGATFTNRQGMVLVKLPAGVFNMGSTTTGGYPGEMPVHTVTLSQGFWMGKFPVTQAQWTAVMGSNPSHFKNAGLDAPVETVSWDDAQAFITKLNGIQNEWRYRLPTEAEWEYACRAGTTGDTYGPVDAIAWHEGNSGGSTHPVGQKQANAFGLHDMLGNVFQWCQDWYGPYSVGSTTDPPGASYGVYRILRGGVWSKGPQNCRAGYREARLSGNSVYYFGFRVVAVARTP